MKNVTLIITAKHTSLMSVLFVENSVIKVKQKSHAPRKTAIAGIIVMIKSGQREKLYGNATLTKWNPRQNDPPPFD